MSNRRQTLGWVTRRPSRTSLRKSRFRSGSVLDLLGQEFEGHLLADLEIVGAVDLAHPTAAELGDDAVAPLEDVAGREPGRLG